MKKRMPKKASNKNVKNSLEMSKSRNKKKENMKIHDKNTKVRKIQLDRKCRVMRSIAFFFKFSFLLLRTVCPHQYHHRLFHVPIFH